MKLAAKLIIVVLAVVVLLTAVGSYFSVRRAFERFEQRQQQMARDAAEAMNEQLTEAWRQGGAEGLSATVDKTQLVEPKHRLRWVWSKQTQVANGQSQTTVVEQLLADGKVVSIEEIELDEVLGGPAVAVGIFLSVFNVHINRSPIDGRVEDVQYRKGRFHAAFSDVASAENEQNTLTIANSDFRVTCAQIAGIVARRIVCWKAPGDIVLRGERIGLIRFGSRVDLVVPAQARVEVRIGDKVKGGASKIAIMEKA